MIENKHDNLRDADDEKLDFAELEKKLNSQLENEISGLKSLQDDFQKIENPAVLGECIKDVIWDQFLVQIGGKQGTEFIKENRGLTLDLRKSAHTQTSENFEKGKIATHNPYIDYQKRYNDWQNNFKKDANGNVVMHATRSGERVPTFDDPKAVRRKYKGHPTGSLERKTDMDHTISAAEITRDVAANAHLEEKERVAFANSTTNLNEIPSTHNRSKGENRMYDWLNNPNSKGQKPREQFADPLSNDYLSDDLENKYLEKDKQAREAYEKLKQQGEQRSVETGKKSRQEEAFRIGKSAIKTVIYGLLIDLIKTVIKKMVAWLLSAKKDLASLLESLKNAITEFVTNLRERLINIGTSFVTTIVTAIFKPAANLIKNIWVLLKQGYKSIKGAVDYLKNPQNKELPFSIKLMQVGKILTAGLAAGGAVLLGEVIEKGLMTIPIFTVQIPLLGSLANILGIFFGALVSGIIGAIALNLIDKAISNKMKQINQEQQNDKKNEIIQTQSGLVAVSSAALATEKKDLDSSIKGRHKSASEEMNKSIEKINQNAADIKSNSANDNVSVINKLNNLLDNL